MPAPARGGSVPIAVRRHWLVGEIERRLRIRGGVGPGAKVAVGVSGGADSTALLLGCAALRERQRSGTPSVRPLVVHVHHHLRPSADDDAAFVTELCDRFELELRVEHIRPGSMAGNLAANARRLRYRALQRAAREWGGWGVGGLLESSVTISTSLRSRRRMRSRSNRIQPARRVRNSVQPRGRRGPTLLGVARHGYQ